MDFAFPDQLDLIKEGLKKQKDLLCQVASVYADAIEGGGLVHIYANGHSRQSVEETVIRMGALTGFRPILSSALTTFNDVIGANGVRVNQFYEKIEGIGAVQLKETDFGPQDVLTVVTATGTTAAAVDIALEFGKQYPGLNLVGIASRAQSSQAKPKHSSGKNLIQVIEENPRGFFIDNSMPLGDLSVAIDGETDTYHVCPLSTIGAVAVTQSLNELTVRELDRRGVKHHVLRNMHIANTAENYDAWLEDQHRRYALATHNPQKVVPLKS